MNVLAFDTCFDACSVAAGRGLRSLSPSIISLFEPMHSGQAERLMPMIEEAMSATGMKVEDLDVIAITSGPGTFTGTRITTATARALALYANTPLVTVSALQLMAMSPDANATGADILAIATDARRGEVYFEIFDPHTLVSLGPPQALTVEAAAASFGNRLAAVAGSGAQAVADAANRLGITARAVAPRLLPDAFDLLFLAMELPRQVTVQPLYLRPPDAKPPSGAALART